MRSLIRLTELRQFGGAADTTLGINVGPLVDVFLADARSDYTFVEACKKKKDSHGHFPHSQSVVTHRASSKALRAPVVVKTSSHGAGIGRGRLWAA